MTTEIDWNDEDARSAYVQSLIEAEVAGLKTKNSELLGTNKALQNKTKEFEEAEAARQHEAAIAKDKAKGDYEAALKKIAEAKEAEVKAANDRLAALEGRLKTSQFQKDATEMLAAEGGITKLLMPIIQSAVETDFDENHNVVYRIKGEDGNVDPNLTLKDFIAGLKKSEDFGAAFRSTAAGGTGASTSVKVGDTNNADNPFVTGNVTKQLELYTRDPALWAKQKAAAGK